MQVDPVKLSDFESESDFINAVIKNSCRCESIELRMSMRDIDQIKRLMSYAEEIRKLTDNRSLSFWVFADSRGQMNVGVSWMGYLFSEIQVRDTGEGWEEVPTTEEVIKKSQKIMEAQCK